MNELDKSSKENNLHKTNELSHFFNSQTLSFISKKSEKISCAIYLITNHLNDKEPLKWLIRELGLDLIKDIFSIKDSFSEDSFIIKRVELKIRQIISYLDLLLSTGFISGMNHKILRGEMDVLMRFLAPEYGITNSEKSEFSEDFFDVDQSIPSIESNVGIKNSSMEHSKNSQDPTLTNHSYLDKRHKGHYPKGQVSFTKMSLRDSIKNNAQEKDRKSGSDRKQMIIRLIKDKNEVNIKDVISSIKGYSEKTLQRDLVSLVKAGVLKREGERRWSRYMIA